MLVAGQSMLGDVTERIADNFEKRVFNHFIIIDFVIHDLTSLPLLLLLHSVFSFLSPVSSISALTILEGK